MANILDTRTVGSEVILVVDADPAAGAGTPAIPSSMAMLDGNSSSTGHIYMKFGTADTDWAEMANNGSYVDSGIAGRLALYPVTGTGVDDVYVQNSQNIDINVVAQPTRSADIEYTIPNPGDAVTSAEFVLTEGAQTINGDKTFNGNTVINGSLDVNGTLTTIDTINLQVTDKLITLNRDGLANSGDDSGFEIEEGGVATGYLKTNATRDGWRIKAPGAEEGVFMFDLLTTTQTYTWPDASGTVVLTNTAGVAGQVLFWNSGGTHLTNESGVSSDSLHWDETNNRLGIATSTPARSLDVNGSAIVRGAFRIENSTGVNYEVFQASVNTTDNALTTAQTIATTTDTSMLIEARVVARRTGGTAGTAGDSAAYVRTFRVKNTGGTVTVNSVDSMYTSEDQSGWNVTAVASGTNVNLRVRGATDNDVSWYLTTMVQLSA